MGQFQIASGGGINRHAGVCRYSAQSREMWQLTFLREADIFDNSTCRGQLGAAKLTETVKRRHTVEYA